MADHSAEIQSVAQTQGTPSGDTSEPQKAGASSSGDSIQNGQAPNKTTEKVDVLALMGQLREQLKTQLEGRRDGDIPFRPMTAGKGAAAGELLQSEELRYLNAHYGYAPALRLELVKTHRQGVLGIVGRVAVALKRRVLQTVWDFLLRDYVSAEREYQANLVRYLNHVSKYVDGRDAANFWELVRKIDVDTGKAIERSERTADEFRAALYSMESKLAAQLGQSDSPLQRNLHSLNASVARHDSELRTLDSVTKGMEGLLAQLHQLGQPAPTAPQAAPPKVPDLSYVLLENRYRGSEQEIARRQQEYVALLAQPAKKLGLPILEIGAGRGELLQQLKQAGAEAYGVDLNEAMVILARERGCRSELGDGIAHLASLDDASLAGLIAVQVVEHLSREQLVTLCQLAKRKIASGGILIFETINPCSILALSSNYFRDPTHVWPQHPDTLSYTLSQSGFTVSECRPLSPVPAEYCLRSLPIEPEMPPRWVSTIESLNTVIGRLNQFLFGHQDYCVIARVP